MIPLTLPAVAEASAPYVVRLRGHGESEYGLADAQLIRGTDTKSIFSSREGLLEISGVSTESLLGDVVLVEPQSGRLERLIRAGSAHNTLLVTERCDQLCVMCSQPPKKTHVDRFEAFKAASLLAEPHSVIGVSGGEPTLYKSDLLTMIEEVLRTRSDLEFHVLTNGQHFETHDVQRLRDPLYQRVQWGVPLYAHLPMLHDDIVGKPGAFERLQESFAHLVMAGARVELRTVLLSSNIHELPRLAQYVTSQLRSVDAWSIMQLENIGFARNRWSTLYVDHRDQFDPIARALNHAILHGISARLFNFTRCSVPPNYREFAAASISDWKRRYATACAECTERSSCCGFFEWHPDPDAAGVTPL